MQIIRNTIETTPGPSEWFTGAVYLDSVATPSEPSRLSASSVHFTPGARTAWHTHPNGQTIYVTEGVGLAQRRGGPIEVIHPGDRVFFEPGEDLDAASAGYRVGYGDASHFTREYKRLFGAPPARDVERLREAEMESASL